jgi:hypothetical protein
MPTNADVVTHTWQLPLRAEADVVVIGGGSVRL